MWHTAHGSRLAQPWRPLDSHSNRVLTGSRRSALTVNSSGSSQRRNLCLVNGRMASCSALVSHKPNSVTVMARSCSCSCSSANADTRQPRSLVRTAVAAAAACPFPDHHAAAAAAAAAQSSRPRSPARKQTSSHGQAIDMLINLKRSSSSQDPHHPLNPAAGPNRYQLQQEQQQQQQGYVGAESFLYPDESHNSWQISTQIRHSVEEAIKAIVHIPGSSSGTGSASSSSTSKWQGLYQIEWQEEQQRLLLQQQQQQQFAVAPQQQQHNEAVALQDRIGSNAHAASSSSSSSSDNVAAAAGVVQSPHALTRKIQACKDAAALEQLLQQHWSQLDHIHVATSFVQLARMQRSSSGNHSSSSSSGVSADMLQQLQQLASSQLPFMQSRHVANIVRATAALHLSPPQHWVQALLNRAEELFSRGTAPQGFANTLWAAANLRVQPSSTWMDAFFKASQPQLHNFQAQELSSTIWALGSLAVQPPPAWQYSFVTASTAKMGSCSAQALSNQLWAVAKLGLVVPEHWTAAVTYAAQMRAKDFTPLGLSNLLWATAMLHGKQQQQQQQQHGSRSNGVAAAGWVQQPAANASSSSSSSSMGRVLSSSSSSSSSSGSGSGTTWLQPLLTAATPHVQHFNAHCLSNVIWSLSVLEHSSSPEFVRACADQLLLKSNKLSAAGAAGAIWGLARFGVLPDPEHQMAPLMRHLEEVLPASNAQQLVYIAAALACFRQQQQQQQSDSPQQQQSAATVLPQQLLQQFLSTCQSRLHQFAPGQLCELGRWLAAAAVRPDAQWTDVYLSSIAQQLGRLKPQHHVTVLKTLGVWKVQPHPGWAAMFLAAVAAEQAVGSYSAGHIAALLQGFTAAEVQPQQQQLELLLQQALLDMSHSSSSSAAPSPRPAAAAAAGVLQGLCGLGFRPSESWLRRFWDAGVHGGLVGADSASLAALAVALQLPELGQLQMRPSKLWSAAYHAAVAAILSNSGAAAAPTAAALQQISSLDVFTPKQAAAVLAALATAKLQPKQQHEQLLPDLLAVAGSGLQQLSYAEAVAAWWSVVELGVLTDAVPLSILQQPQQREQLEVEKEQEGRQYSGVWQSQRNMQQQQQQQEQRPQQQQQQQQQSHWLQHLLLSPGVELQLAALDLRGLLQLAACLGRLQQPTPSSWADTYITALSPHIPQLQPHQLVSVLCAVPTLSTSAQRDSMTAQLLAAIQPHLSDLSPKQLSEVLVMTQQSGTLPPEPWLADYITAASGRLPDFLGRQLIRVLTALARLRFSPETGFLQEASNTVVDKLGSGVPAAMLVDLLWALTAFQMRPSAAWLARFQARLLEKGPERLDGAQLSRLGWCLAALQVKPGQLLMARYIAAAGEQLHSMDARSLADTIWACAMLDETPNRQWLDSFMTASRQHLPVFPSGALVTVMWALAMMQHRPPSDWMARCLTAIGSCLAAGNNVTHGSNGVTSGLRGAGASGLLLQRPQLPGTAGYNSSTAGDLNPGSSGSTKPQQQPLTLQQVSRLAWALAVLDCQLPAQLMQQLLQRAESQIGMLDSDNLAQIVWSLDRLDDTQDKLWVRQFAAAARAHLLARPPRLPNSSGLAAAAAAGFRPPVQGDSAGLGVVVRSASVGQQQQQGGVPSAAPAGVLTAASVSRAAAAAAAAGIVVQKDIAEELKKSGMSKQELLAKLRQMKHSSE